MRNEWVGIEVSSIEAETEKAFLFRFDDELAEWFPKSQLRDPEAYEVGDCDLTIDVSLWIAKQKDVEIET